MLHTSLMSHVYCLSSIVSKKDAPLRQAKKGHPKNQLLKDIYSFSGIALVLILIFLWHEGIGQ